MGKAFYFLGILLILALPASGQQSEDRFAGYAQLLSPEKLYLQTDREVYRVGDTVWFKGYLDNAARTAEFPAGNYIYVELLSSLVEKNIQLGATRSTESVRVRVKVKRRDDGFAGWLAIPENLNTGTATLRAYSYWMLNREPEYMFYKELELRNPMKDDFVEMLVREEVREDAKYTEMGVSNPFGKEAPDRREVDVQFLPESGRWLLGEPSTFGIRAVDGQGAGIPLNGDIFADEALVGHFVTDPHGLGRVELTLTVPVKELYAQVYAGETFLSRVQLPLPDGQAAVVHVRPQADGIAASVSQQGLALPDSTWIIVHDKDEIYLQVPYTEQTRRLKIPYDLLSPGINNMALVDAAGTVYAERAFFVYPGLVQHDIVLDKPEYGPREKVSARIDLPAGDYSVAVSDDGYAPVSGRGYDLVSWWYLGSELPSFVEDAPGYFDESRPLAERIAAVDLVMLTHGWHYYDLPDVLLGKTAMPLFGKEYTQSLSGEVRSALRQAKRSVVSFVAPAIGYSTIGQLDTTGFFVLNGLDFPEGTQFLVAAETLGGNTRRFTPFLNDDIFAVFHHYPSYLGPTGYSAEYRYDMLKDYYDAGGEIVYSLYPSFIKVARPSRQYNISPLPDYQFKQGQYRSETELEPYKALDVLTYIVSTCPPLRFATADDAIVPSDSTGSDEGGEIAASYRTIVCRTQKIATQMGISSGWEEIIVFRDGMRSSCADLDGLSVADLTGFAYITGSDALKFNSGADNALAPKSVVMVKTRLYAHDVAVNVSSGKPLGWQQQKHFYNPLYEDARSRKEPEPIRATLYWNPSLEAGSDSPASFDFYSSDHKADATIIVEGFTREGVPVSIKGKLHR
ncbi:MAG: hypothetical protein IKX34_08770 [Bacteroidales bacterium]|nr:hypothetical protein [Bacteroidales bacterium]